jgi:hypothetical protein
MQFTEPVEESRDNMGHLLQVEEHQVDKATDMKADDVRVEEVVAQGADDDHTDRSRRETTPIQTGGHEYRWRGI